MMELVIYGLALGVSATLIVPLVYGLVRGFIPATISGNVNIPSGYPASGAAILWSVVVWGVLLGGSIWLVSMFKPVGRAIREEA